ncbi:MAG: flagellar biosynthetic protein FliQ [Myxococcaceae bacterium]|nr:flagellar biosynthetic protein FliQ [Myxococcaceae bacterium]
MPSALVHEALTLLAVVGGPLFLGLFVAGLLLGVLQAATQINDPSVGFLPRIGVAVGTCALLGGWMMERMASFLAHAMERMSGHGF